MKNKKYLRFYKDCIKTGEMPCWGLCAALGVFSNLEFIPEFALIMPTDSDFMELIDGGLAHVYWGSGLSPGDAARKYTFTPLRQTLVLLMAAIAGELDD